MTADKSTGPTKPPSTVKARSLGLKLLLVGFLAFVIWLPCMLIYVLSWERSNRSDQVKAEIHALRGGEQRVTGPYLLVPAIVKVTYTDEYARERTREERRTIVFLPNVLEAKADIETQTLNRSIYEATVYTTKLTLNGSFRR